LEINVNRKTTPTAVTVCEVIGLGGGGVLVWMDEMDRGARYTAAAAAARERRRRRD